jgi:cobalt-zinc-cadmium efflux system outer membrane protein
LAQRAGVIAAEARIRAAGYTDPATISLEIEEVPGGMDLADAGSVRLDVARQIFSGGRVSARKAAAEVDAERSRIVLHAVSRRVSAQSDRLLTRAAAAMEVAARLALQDLLLSRAEEALRTRFAVGEARFSDVLRVRTERLRAQTDQATAESEARTWRLELLSLLGADGATGESVRLVDSAIAEEREIMRVDSLPGVMPVDSLVALDVDLMLAEMEVVRARALAQLRQASLRPVLSAAVGVQRFEVATGHVVGPVAGVEMTLPFTSARGGVREAAEQAITTAEAVRDAARVAARTRVMLLSDRYGVARDRLARFDAELLRGALEERESALASYQSGDLSLMELIDFERALARAEIARFRTIASAADIRAALEAGASDDNLLETDSAWLSEDTE